MIFVNRKGDERCESSTAQRLPSPGFVQRRDCGFPPQGGFHLPVMPSCLILQLAHRRRQGIVYTGAVQPILSHSKGLGGPDDKCS